MAIWTSVRIDEPYHLLHCPGVEVDQAGVAGADQSLQQRQPRHAPLLHHGQIVTTRYGHVNHWRHRLIKLCINMLWLLLILFLPSPSLLLQYETWSNIYINLNLACLSKFLSLFDTSFRGKGRNPLTNWLFAVDISSLNLNTHTRCEM